MHSAASLGALDGGADVSPRLVVASVPGLARGMSYDVADGAVLGRGDVEIQLEDPFASSQHARLTRQGAILVIEDLGSTNGTYLNDELLRGPAAAAPRRPRPHRRFHVHVRELSARPHAPRRHRPLLALRHRPRPARERGRLLRARAGLRRRRRDGRRAGRRGRVAGGDRGLRARPGRRRRRQRRGAARRARAGGQPAHPRDVAGVDGPRRHGHDDHRRARRRARRGDRARRRLARVSPARRGVHAPDRGPLARRGDAPPRPAHRPGGRRAPAALDHHPRARARARRGRRHALLARRRGRRLPAVQRRPDLDGARVAGGRHRARRADAARRRPRADRRRQPGRRARQHHGRAVSPRGGRHRRTTRRTSTRPRPAAPRRA